MSRFFFSLCLLFFLKNKSGFSAPPCPGGDDLQYSLPPGPMRPWNSGANNWVFNVDQSFVTDSVLLRVPKQYKYGNLAFQQSVFEKFKYMEEHLDGAKAFGVVRVPTEKFGGELRHGILMEKIEGRFAKVSLSDTLMESNRRSLSPEEFKALEEFKAKLDAKGAKFGDAQGIFQTRDGKVTFRPVDAEGLKYPKSGPMVRAEASVSRASMIAGLAQPAAAPSPIESASTPSFQEQSTTSVKQPLTPAQLRGPSGPGDLGASVTMGMAAGGFGITAYGGLTNAYYGNVGTGMAETAFGTAGAMAFGGQALASGGAALSWYGAGTGSIGAVTAGEGLVTAGGAMTGAATSAIGLFPIVVTAGSSAIVVGQIGAWMPGGVHSHGDWSSINPMNIADQQILRGNGTFNNGAPVPGRSNWSSFWRTLFFE